MEIILTIAFGYSQKENRRLEGLLIEDSKSRHPAYRAAHLVDEAVQ